MKLSKIIIFGLSILDFSVVIDTKVKGWHEQKSTYYFEGGKLLLFLVSL